MPKKATSHNGVVIRLPDERWQHIVARHSILADQQKLFLETLANSDRILAGNEGALMAVKQLEPERWLVIVYREEDEDGFMITAFLTRKINSLNRRKQRWP